MVRLEWLSSLGQLSGQPVNHGVQVWLWVQTTTVLGPCGLPCEFWSEYSLALPRDRPPVVRRRPSLRYQSRE